MRLPAILFSFLSASILMATEPQPPEPDSLLSWLRIIDIKGYRLLHASDQNGFYFAVKVDSDGDILFCHHEQSKPATAAGTSTIRIADPKSDADLQDPKSKKTGPEPVTITYVREIPDGVVRIQTATNVTFPTGSLYPLNNREIGAVHITWTREDEHHEKKVLFYQLVQLPHSTGKSEKLRAK